MKKKKRESWLKKRERKNNTKIMHLLKDETKKKKNRRYTLKGNTWVETKESSWKRCLKMPILWILQVNTVKGMTTLLWAQNHFLSFYFLCLPHRNLSPVTTEKDLKKCVLCVSDMKGETIQTYESILHILKFEWKHFNPERIGKSVK